MAYASKVHCRPINSLERVEFAEVFTFEVPVVVDLGDGERVVPIVQKVYRTDPELSWGEIRDGVYGVGEPLRYSVKEKGVMSRESFHKFIRRFRLLRRPEKAGYPWLVEKGSGKKVLHDNPDWLESILMDEKNDVWFVGLDPASVVTEEEYVDIAIEKLAYWFVDTEARVRGMYR
ncbi:hypothetical protein VKT23_006347 [Stygiomarasmius scandens]|uniref:Uncharacterized protein n=1 Tax=Marasmiellus scandens TaxID=2682957 RepID=A0ABR1JMK1_9AGAR